LQHLTGQQTERLSLVTGEWFLPVLPVAAKLHPEA